MTFKFSGPIHEYRIFSKGDTRAYRTISWKEAYVVSEDASRFVSDHFPTFTVNDFYHSRFNSFYFDKWDFLNIPEIDKEGMISFFGDQDLKILPVFGYKLERREFRFQSKIEIEHVKYP